MKTHNLLQRLIFQINDFIFLTITQGFDYSLDIILAQLSSIAFFFFVFFYQISQTGNVDSKDMRKIYCTCEVNC